MRHSNSWWTSSPSRRNYSLRSLLFCPCLNWTTLQLWQSIIWDAKRTSKGCHYLSWSVATRFVSSRCSLTSSKTLSSFHFASLLQSWPDMITPSKFSKYIFKTRVKASMKGASKDYSLYLASSMTLMVSQAPRKWTQKELALAWVSAKR